MGAWVFIRMFYLTRMKGTELGSSQERGKYGVVFLAIDKLDFLCPSLTGGCNDESADILVCQEK